MFFFGQPLLNPATPKTSYRFFGRPAPLPPDLPIWDDMEAYYNSASEISFDQTGPNSDYDDFISDFESFEDNENWQNDSDVLQLLAQYYPKFDYVDLEKPAIFPRPAQRAHVNDEPKSVEGSRFKGRAAPVDDNALWLSTEECKILPTLWKPSQASQLILIEMIKYFFAFQRYERVREEYEAACVEAKKWGLEKPAKPYNPKPKLLGIRSTTGLGKSSSAGFIIRLALKKGIPLLIVARDHEALSEYEKYGLFHFYGRTKFDSENPYAEIKEWSCRNNDLVKALSFQNHFPAATLCRDRCKFGKKFQLEKAVRHALQSGNIPEEDEEVMSLMKWFKYQNLSPPNIPACEWQGHNDMAKNSIVLGVTHQSYSQKIADYAYDDYKCLRLVIFDEAAPMGKEIQITSADIRQWISSISVQIENYISSIKRLEEPEIDQVKARNGEQSKNDYWRVTRNGESLFQLRSQNSEQILELQNSLKQYLQAKKIYDQILDDMQHVSEIKGAHPVPEKTIQMFEKIKIETDGLWTGGTATWERVRFNQLDIETLPLRASDAILFSFKMRFAYFEGNVLHVIQMTAAGEDICSGRPAILLDATMPSGTVDIIKAREGKIVDIISSQNIRLRRFPKRMFGRGLIDKKRDEPSDYVKKNLDHAIEAVRHLPNDLGRSLLTHLAWLKPLYEEHENNPGTSMISKLREEGIEVGHFGKYDVAHNLWINRHIVIFGGMLLETKNYRQQYNIARAAAIYAGSDSTNWPIWANDEGGGRGSWVDEGSGFLVKTKYSLPDNDHIRAWLLDHYSVSIIQAVGRPRAVWSEQPIVIEIFGGLPVDFSIRGLEVASYHRDEEFFGWRDVEAWNTEQKDEADQKWKVALQRLLSIGEKISVRSIQKELSAMVAEGVIEKSMSNTSIAKRLEVWKETQSI